jgi:hypothetical protein
MTLLSITLIGVRAVVASAGGTDRHEGEPDIPTFSGPGVAEQSAFVSGEPEYPTRASRTNLWLIEGEPELPTSSLRGAVRSITHSEPGLLTLVLRRLLGVSQAVRL